MVRVNCNYIPAWPIVYYKTKEIYRVTQTILHILWPLFVWNEKDGNKLLALFYILFRLTYKEKTNTQYIDFFWPIIHFEYNDDGFRFGIRPLMWIISGKGSFKFSLMGIINIFSKDDGNDVWFTIAPFIWYRYKSGRVFFTLFPILWITKRVSGSNEKWMVLLLPAGLLRYHVGRGFSLNIALLINIAVFDDLFQFFILPFFIFHNRIGERIRVNVALLFYYSTSSTFKRFVIFPFLWARWSEGKTTFNFIPLLIYMKRQDSVFLSICFMYYYRKISDAFKLHLIPLALYYQVSGDFKFLNVALLYTYTGDSNKWWHVVLPIFWFKKKVESHYFIHLWPIFGYRRSWEERGYSVYFIYPFVQFNNYYDGTWIYNHVFYRFIHYFRNDQFARKRHGFLPFYAHSNSNVYNKGHILLYVWYYQKTIPSTTNIKLDEIIRISEPVQSKSEAVSLPEDDYPPLPPQQEPVIEESTTTKGGEEISAETRAAAEEQETTNPYSFIFKSFLPLAFYFNSNGISRFYFIPLFFMKWCEFDIDSYFVSPIYYQRKWGTSLKRFIIPIFYQKHTEDKDLILSPIYYYWRNLANSFRLIAPIFIDVHKAETHLMILVFPTFIYYRKSIFKFQTIFPFFFRTQDASKNEIFTYYFPFYGKSYRGSKTNRYFLFPIFRIKLGRDESKLFSVDFLFPLFHYESNGTDNSHSIRILPFFWKSKNDYNEMLLVMPFFWRFITDKDTRAQRNTLVFPFYYFRDSSEYMFTFASPAFLPPYYIHYHREASNVENRYLLPFYSHQIKGLDHLKWIFWFLYRHTYRDYSDYFTMNILLFFKHNSEKYSITGLAPLWVYWNDKVEGGKHLRIALLVAYDNVVSKLKEVSRLSILWFFTTHVTLFCRQKVLKRSISKAHSVADSIDQMVLNETLSTDRQVDTNNMERMQVISKSTKTYLFPLFHTKSDCVKDSNHFALFWLFKPFIAFFYKSRESSEHLWYVFLMLYHRFDNSASTFAVIWLFHPIISCFLYENSPFSWIVRMFPLFWYRKVPDASKPKDERDISMDTRGNGSVMTRKRSSTRITVSEMALSILYIVPNYGLFNLRKSQLKYSVFFLPLFYYLNSVENDLFIFSLFWFISPIISLFNYNRIGNVITHRMVPLYYRISSSERSLFSFIWLAHPYVSFLRFDRDSKYSIFSIFPLFWRRKGVNNPDYHLSIIYLVRKYGFIDYWSNDDLTRFYILCIFFFNRINNKTKVTFIYPIHPKASFITAKFTPDYSKIFVFLALYFKNSVSKGFILSMFWIAHPKVSFISYWSKNAMSHFHIFLVLWVSTIEEYVQFGMFWIGATKKSLYGNHHLNQGVPDNQKIHEIRKPISLILAYNDGEYKTIHFMPLFRYWSKSSSEMEKFWALLGLVYFSAKQSTSQFRFFYRWIRVKTGSSLFILELNPFFAYKKKNERSTVLILGGMCGCYTSMCRVCCIEC